MERKTEIRSLYGLYSILSHYRAPFLFYFQTLKFATILRNRFGGWFFETDLNCLLLNLMKNANS